MKAQKGKTKSRADYLSWDECFMRMAHIIAGRSKDPSTQTGAVIVSDKNVVLGMGYNGWPKGTKDSDFPWERKGAFLETKYAYVCHAEENAIFNANKSVENGKIYCLLFPCNECAKAMIQNGIKEIIYESDKYHNDDIWIASRKLLDAAGIKYRQYVSASAKENQENKKMSGKIILGLSGPIGAGKTEAATYLKTKHKAEYIGFSSILREISKDMKIEENRKNLQNLSISLRDKFGQDIISLGILKKIKDSKKKIIVLESIRRKEDLNAFADFPVYLIYIDADSTKKRFFRIKKRNENKDDQTKNWAEFQKEAKKDTEITILGLKKMADFVLANTGSLNDFRKKLDEIIAKIS